jgi:O-antigen/teichoic acid export membrane protein
LLPISIGDLKKMLRRPNDGDFSQKVISTFFTQILNLFLSLATSAIIARWLGPAGKGVLGLALLVPGMMVLLLGGGIEVANVYFTASRRLDVACLTANSVAFALLSTIVGAGIAVGLIAGGWLEIVARGVPGWLYLIAMLGLPVGLLSSYFRAVLLGLQRIVTINMINLAQSGGALVLTLLLLVGFHLGLFGAVMASLGAGTIGLIATSVLLSREGGAFAPRWDPSVMRVTVSFGLKEHIGNALQFFNYRLDMFIVNYFLGSSIVGIYSVSVGLAELLWRLPNAVGFVMLPKVATMQPESLNRFTPHVLRTTMGLTALGALGLVMLGKPLIQMIYASAFVGAYVPMLVLLPGVVLLGGVKVISSDITGRGHPAYNSINSGVALALTVVLDLLLIPRYGIIGAAMASSIAYTAHFLIAIAFYLAVSRSAREATPMQVPMP